MVAVVLVAQLPAVADSPAAASVPVLAGSRRAEMRRVMDDPCKDVAAAIHKQLLTQSVTIPFHYGPEGTILLPLRVGSREVQVTLDTGCAQTTFWSETLPSDAKVESKLDDNFFYGSLPDVHLGGIDLGRVAIWVCSRNVRGVRTDAETAVGLLGGNIFKNFDLTIDYPGKTVTLSNPGTQFKKFPGANVVPVHLQFNQAKITLMIHGKTPIDAGVDTGSVFNAASEDRLRPALALGGKFKQYLLVDDVKLGESKFPDVVFQILGGSHPEIPVLIGGDLLSRFLTTFDYQNNRLILAPSTSTEPSAINDLSAGNLALVEDHQKEAIEALSKVIDKEPELAFTARTKRARAYSQISQYEHAVDDFTFVLNSKLSSTYLQSGALSGRARCYTKLKKYQQAIADLNRAISLESHTLEDVAAEGHAGNHSPGLLKLASDHEIYMASLYGMRGESYGRLEKWSLADTDLGRAIQIQPNESRWYVLRGYSRDRLGNWPKAVDDYSHSIRLSSNSADAYLRRGYAYAQLKDLEKALADCNAAIRLQPYSGEPLYFRSRVYEMFGKKDLAKKDRENAKTLGYTP